MPKRPPFFLFPILLAASCAGAWGAQRTIEVAIPEASGRLSLALFDASGGRVRLLADIADISEFEQGLNGIILRWDGRDDSGRPVPRGSYQLRGVFIPPTVEVTGEAFLFNDWEGPAGVPPITNVLALTSRGDGNFLLCANDPQTLDPVIWRGDAGGQLADPRRMESGIQVLALDTQGALVVRADRISWLRLDEENLPGEGRFLVELPGVSLAALHRDLAAISIPGSKRIALFGPGNDGSSGYALPEEPRLLSAAGNGFVTILRDGSAFLLEDGVIKKISVGDTTDIASLSEGPMSSFWVVGSTGEGARVVRNFHPEQGLLREMRLDSEAGEVTVVGNGTSAGFFLIIRTGSATIVQSFQPANSGTWETAFERRILDSRNFGFLGDRAAPLAPAENRIKVGLAPSLLDPAPRVAILQIACSATGARLETSDGLGVIEVAHLPNIHRAALRPGVIRGNARVLLGQPGYVVEFHVKRLRGLSLLDEGIIEVME